MDPSLDGVELLVDAAPLTSEFVVEVHDPGPGQNYVPRHLITAASAAIAAGDRQWVRLDLPWRPESPRNAFLVVRKNRRLAFFTADRPVPGSLSFSRRPLGPQDERPQPLREWSDRELLRRSFCFRAGATQAYAPAKAVDGYQRPYAGPHMWVSEPMDCTSAPWLELSWPRAATFRRVDIIADDDVNEDLVNLHHHRTPFDVIPTLIRDYRIEVRMDGQWRVFAEVRDNRRRRCSHASADPVSAEAVRVMVTATNGAPSAHLQAVRIFGN